jgi:light-regulated signal transduction histidine kinase (bacteriophytochrome)
MRQLEEKNRELERSNEDLAQFASAVSHDLQEPLRTISVYIQLLERKLDASEAKPTKLLDGLTGAAARMRDMIQDLLTLSRVSQSGQSSFSKVNLSEAVERARQNLAAAIAESGAVLDCGPLGEVMGDLSQFTLVFQNLIGNAIKYSAGNNPRIIISSTQETSLHRVSVRDNGMGIDSKYHERIFGLFNRLHSAAKISGTGIGLAITQRVVERHGGRIWVESELGKGANFVFTVPALGATDMRPTEGSEEFRSVECDALS